MDGQCIQLQRVAALFNLKPAFAEDVAQIRAAYHVKLSREFTSGGNGRPNQLKGSTAVMVLRLVEG